MDMHTKILILLLCRPPKGACVHKVITWLIIKKVQFSHSLLERSQKLNMEWCCQKINYEVDFLKYELREDCIS